jgi:hypothetical protein
MLDAVSCFTLVMAFYLLSPQVSRQKNRLILDLFSMVGDVHLIV